MTRRELLSFAAAGAAAFSQGCRNRQAWRPARPQSPLVVPVNVIADSQARWGRGELRSFHTGLWAQAVEDFRRCGILLQEAESPGGIWRPPGREPIVSGLRRAAVNLAITNRIPMEWDQGRTLSGVTLSYRGYALCAIALDHAHGHQLPLLSVNTCTHELLHVLLLDVLEERPGGVEGQARELRVDWYATRMWLFHDGAAVRRSARIYLQKLATRAAASG